MMTSLPILWISCAKDPKVDNKYDGWKSTTEPVVNAPINLDVNTIQGIHFYVFKPTCSNSGCHDGTFEPDFRTVESSYNSLVNVPVKKEDLSVPGQFALRVEPGNAANSMLIRRCEIDLGGNSGIMPLSLDPGNDFRDRKAEYLQRIATWINNGAKDQSGKAVAAKDLKPQMAGMVVEVGGNAMPRFGNYYPAEVPVGSGNITIYFAYLDDITSPAQFTNLAVDTSQNPSIYKGSGALTLSKLGAARTLKGLFQNDRDYWHSVTLNVSNYRKGQVLWFKTTVSDNVNPTVNIPDEFANFNNQKYFAIRFL